MAAIVLRWRLWLAFHRISFYSCMYLYLSTCMTEDKTNDSSTH